jgi:hypothetical protein
MDEKNGIDSARIERLEQLLEDNIELAEENNKLIRSIRRGNRIAFWLKVVLWVIILGLPFFFIGPIMNALVPFTGSAKASNSSSVFGVPSPKELEAAYTAFKQHQGSSGATSSAAGK